MTTTTRRTENEAVRREQILAAARKAFREKGFANTTISEIVKEAGVAQGTFYLYFPSKAHVVAALAQVLMDQMAPRMRAIYQPSMSFEDMLRSLVRIMFEIGSENPDLCRLLHQGPESATEEFREMKAEIARPLHTDMVDMFQRAIDAGEMAPVDPEVTVGLLSQFLVTAIHEAFVYGDGSDAQKIEQAAAEMIVNGLKHRP